MSHPSRSSLADRIRLCVATLQPLGFPEHQCRAAAEACSGEIDRATEYLLSGSANIPPPPPQPPKAATRGSAAAAVAATAAARPSPSFQAHAPAPLSTPASRAAAAGPGMRPNPALSPSAALAAALQSPKRHLANPNGERGGGAYAIPPPPAFAAAAGLPTRGAALPPYSTAARPPSPSVSMVDVPGRHPSPAARASHNLRMHLSDDSSDLTDMNGVAATPASAAAAAPATIKFTQQSSAMSTRSSGPVSARGHPTGNGNAPQVSITPREPAPYQSSLSRLKVVPPPTPTPTAAAAGGAAGSLAATPQASGPPQTPVSVSDLSPYAPALSPPALQSLLNLLSTWSPPASRSAASLRAHTLSLGTESLPLGPNSFIDVRDPLGKWLEAQVLRNEWAGAPRNLEHLRIYVHYVNWDDRWNETIAPIQDPSRIAPFRTWSDSAKQLSPAEQAAAIASGSRSVAPAWVRVGESVVCYFIGDDRRRASQWVVGRIMKLDGPQMQVETLPPLLPSVTPPERPKKVQRWFHAHSDLVMPINRVLNELQAIESAQREERRQQRYWEQQQQQAALHEQQQNQLSPSPSPFSPVSPGGLLQSGGNSPHPGATSPVHPSQQAPQTRQQQQPSLSGSGPRPSSGTPHHRLGSYPSAPAAAAQSLSLSLSQSQQQGSASNPRPPSVPVVPSQYNTSLPFTQAPAQHCASPPPAAAAPGATAAAAAATAPEPAWFVNQFLEVKDSVGKFLPAEVLKVQPAAATAKGRGGTQIYVHYEGWSHKWDEWLDVVADASRIRALGSALEDSAEEKARKEEELQFRARMMKQHGFTIVDCESDGNCLFRAVAHQIYGDVNRHAEVRRACYDYMVRDASYFSTFVSEPFEAYVARRRADKEWGDHLEVVAMREMFNKNVEIYSAKDQGVRGCQPIGSSASIDGRAQGVPMMRLSFHGRNHYNSVVDPAHPPPLGDGSDCPVNMRALRQAQEAAEAEVAAKRASEHAEAVAASEIDDRKTDSSSISAAAYRHPPRSSGGAPPSPSPSPTPMSPMSPARTHSGSGVGGGAGSSGNKLVRSSSSGPNAISPMALAANPSRGAAGGSANGPSPRRTTPPHSGVGVARSPATDPLSSPRRSVSLFRDTSLSSLPPSTLFPERALQVEWARLDPKQQHHIAERHVALLIANIAERLYLAQKDQATAAADQSRLEHLEKVYDEFVDSGEIERMSQAMLSAVPTINLKTPAGTMVKRIPYQSFQNYLYAHTLKDLMWAFSR